MYTLCQAKEFTKKVYNNIINSIKQKKNKKIKNKKNSYKKNKFKISSTTWSEKFDLMIDHILC